ncbi:MAG: molybdenum cofactor guanylyltransferase [Chakrabartia sp.]
MKLLGLVLAGGQSRRFGSDKALALHQGRPLIDHALAGLYPFVADLAVVGRDWPGVRRIEDAPRPGLGPLGGLLGGLSVAEAQGYDAVLTCGCDTLGLTADHVAALSPGPAVLADVPIVGLWPSHLGGALAEWMAQTDRHSVYAFADHIGARRIAAALPPRNINRPEDLI